MERLTSNLSKEKRKSTSTSNNSNNANSGNNNGSSNNNTTTINKPLNSNYSKINDVFKNQLKSYMVGLAKCGEVSSAFRNYEERFLIEMKNIIKSNLPTDLLDSNNQRFETSSNYSGRSETTTTRTGVSGSGAQSLSNNVRSMTPKEFEDVLIKIYCELSESLRRLKTHQKLLLDLAIDCMSDINPNIFNDQPDIIMQLDITNAINQCIETTQVRMSRIIGVRRDQTASISIDYFLRFHSANILFLFECESISGITITADLQDIMNLQTKLFNSQFHQTNIKIITEKVRRETWKDTSFNASTQIILNEIIQTSTDDIWKDIIDLANFKQLTNRTTNNINNNNKTVDDDKRTTLVIDDISIIVPDY
ncbi:unnamed protein product [[Candida] boidinii]|nr:unnamed protein product [[Candida] boidinii]